MRKFVFTVLLAILFQSLALAWDQINISFTHSPNTPYLIGIPEINIDAEEYNTIILKIKSNKSGTARLFWASNLDPQMNEPKSLWFFLDKSDGFKEYVFNMKSQNPYWMGFIGQILIYPENGPEGIEIKSAKAITGNIITNIKSGWREFLIFEIPQARTVNFIYGPKINGASANLYLYWLVILLTAPYAAYLLWQKKAKLSPALVARPMIMLCLFFWIALDSRILLDQARTVALDWQIFHGKSLDEKRALTTLGDFYSFLKFAAAKLPPGSGFDLVHPPYYYYREKANYYLYPTHYDKNSRYILVYDPNRAQAIPNSKPFAAFKEGEYILTR